MEWLERLETFAADLLVVDDDEDIREALADRIEAEGYEVDSAVDGIDALARLPIFDPDLVLLDLQMPRLDGLHDVRQQLLRWLDGDDRAFQEAAVVAMGQSRDVRALPDLRRIADSARGAAIRAAAMAGNRGDPGRTATTETGGSGGSAELSGRTLRCSGGTRREDGEK